MATMRPKKSVDVVREFNFDRYINKIFKALAVEDDEVVGRSFRLTLEAKHEVNLLCHIVAKRIIKKAVDLSRMRQVITLKPLEFETAIKMLFYKESEYYMFYDPLVRHANVSLVHYERNKDKKNKEFEGLTKKALLTVSVSRVENVIRYHAGCLRVSPSASIFLASVLEEIISQIFYFAINNMREKKQKTVTSKHIAQGIKKSETLNFYFANVMLSTSKSSK